MPGTIELNGEIHVTAGRIAEILGFHVRNTTYFARQGMPRTRHAGVYVYPLDRCVEWHKKRYALKDPAQRKTRSSRQQTLCWDCQNAYAGKCPWFSGFRPVEGWKAIDTTVTHCKSSCASKHVTYCPNFKKDPPRR